MKNILRLVMVFFAMGIAGYAFYFFFYEKGGLLSTKDAATLSSQLWSIPFYTHIAFGAIALLIGSFQFFPRLRARFIKWHRQAGKVYVLSVFMASIAALVAATYATGGIVSQVGFGGLATAWFVSNYFAYTHIRAGRIFDHQNWMIRNYALTLAAVTLRLWLLVFESTDLEFVEGYRIVSWLCWVPNLLVAEWIVRQQLQVGAVQGSLVKAE
jgi:hypothetical protein